MTADSYLRYSMSETRVGLAIANGATEDQDPQLVPTTRWLTCSATASTTSSSTRTRRT